MWQVAQRKDVLDYEMLDEFVTLVTETVPDLLDPKQRGKLLLRLRAKVSPNELKLQTMLCLMETVRLWVYEGKPLLVMHLSDYSRAVQK